MSKQFITPDSLRLDSFILASKIVTDFKPDYMVAIWRGGAPIGCYVHEFMKKCGVNTDHISIRTSRYSGIDKTHPAAQVHNLGYLLERLTMTSKVLLVDDVYDTGLSIQAVKDELKKDLKEKCPTDIRVATVYFKPSRNKTLFNPEYYVHTTDKWLVFPHELEGLEMDEIAQNIDPSVVSLLKSIIPASATEIETKTCKLL